VQAKSERVAEPTPELAAEETSDNLPARIPALPTSPRPQLGGSAHSCRRSSPGAIDTTTKPLRSARQVFEETEEIHFSLKRTHRVSVESEEHTTSASRCRLRSVNKR